MSNRRNIPVHNFKDAKKNIYLIPPIKFLISPLTNISHFKSKLRILQQSIDIISPIFKDIENLNQRLDRPQQEIDSFIDQLKRADVLVAKCMEVKDWNFYRKSLLWEKLDEQQVSFLRFFQIDVQFDQAGDMIKILKTVTDVHKRSLDQVDDESKKMVIKDTVVDDCSVIAVSAGGCGKTKAPVTNISNFKSKLRGLQESIDIISPIFKDIENLNQRLDRPQQEIDSFIDQLKRADVLVAECMKVKYWNFNRKSLLSEKLDEQQVSFLRFFQIDVQFDQAEDMIKILKTVTDVHKRSLDQVDESKKMVIKDTVVDDCSVVAVSAKGILSMKDSERLKIPFEKIDAATEKFKTCIGKGGYGWVYKGILSINGIDITVAVKRLNEQYGQGLKEFRTEIQLLSGQEHPNLISLVGYCDEGKEKILVYEYAERGSLDRYIRRNCDATSTTLTWLQRLKICADAARGLNHLHNQIGGHRTIIHRDIKSSNILIDENWVAKISDLGLSKLSATGLGMSVIVSNGCGTPGYCEPEYFTTTVVTKKSDVYSFGIVLFEVLCGRLCSIKYDDGFILSEKSIKENYNKGNWVQIVDPSLREHLGSYSMTKFSEIAYRCLHDDREQRPAMDIVAKELEEILNVQVAVAHELEEKRKHQVVKDSDSDEIQVTIECILDLSN